MANLQYVRDMNMDFIKEELLKSGYSSSDASRATERYRMWLSFAAEHEDIALTPSREVDDAWHVHLASDQYNRDCISICGHILEHDPAGEDDQEVTEGWLNTLAYLPHLAEGGSSVRAGCVRKAGCVRRAGCIRRANIQAVAH